MERARVTVDQLRQLLRYDPETGDFTWLEYRGRKARKGDKAGGFNGGGQLLICIRRRYYTAARLAHLYMTGKWPAAEIDHRNRDSGDNRWSNLRPATRSENCINRRGWSASGFKGVTFYRPTNKYMARIRLNGKLKFLGYFATAEEAHQAYVAASHQYHGSFAAAR